MNRVLLLPIALLLCASACTISSEPDPNGSTSRTSANPSTGSSSNGGQTGSTPVSGGDSSGSGTTSGSSGSDSSSGSAGTGGSGGTSSAPGARVFATSTTYTGSLGGVAGADARCQTVADAQSLGGTWQAWISDGSTSALDHVSGAGPWYAIDGTKVFNNRANLSTVPLTWLSDETGNFPSWYGYSSPWTGATEEGAPAGYDCSGWTSQAGDGMSGTAKNDQTWGGGAGLQACNGKAALICFEK